jgi:hypothetical protein
VQLTALSRQESRFLTGTSYAILRTFIQTFTISGAGKMIREYELLEDLDTIAKKMHDYDSNPITWLNWIKSLLVKLEEQSKDFDPTNQQRYVEMISHLKDAIYTRESTGSW